MATDKNDSMAAVFARSLLELAQAQNQHEPIAKDLQALKQVVEADPSFRDFFSNPAIPREQRAAIIDKTLGAQASPLLRNFLRVAGEHNMLRHLPAISDAYDDLLDELLGKVEVDLTAAQPITPDQLENARRRIGEALKKDVVVHPYVDESIIGGVIIRVGDQVIDASVRSQLESMRQKLLSAK